MLSPWQRAGGFAGQLSHRGAAAPSCCLRLTTSLLPARLIVQGAFLGACFTSEVFEAKVSTVNVGFTCAYAGATWLWLHAWRWASKQSCGCAAQIQSVPSVAPHGHPLPTRKATQVCLPWLPLCSKPALQTQFVEALATNPDLQHLTVAPAPYPTDMRHKAAQARCADDIRGWWLLLLGAGLVHAFRPEMLVHPLGSTLGPAPAAGPPTRWLAVPRWVSPRLPSCPTC